jgi:hypothetical protein
MSDPLVFTSEAEPVIQTSPEADPGRGVLPSTFTIDPERCERELQAKSKRELQENFDKFLPSGDDALEAPTEQAKEPVAEPARAERKERKAVRKSAEPEAERGESDPLDEFSPHPQASEKTRSSFGELKEITKNFRQRCRTLENFVAELGYKFPDDPEQLSPMLEKIRPEIQARLQSGLAPEVQTELERLRVLEVQSTF